MKIAVDGVLRPMSDERAIDLALRNVGFRTNALRVTEKLLREHPDARPEEFPCGRVIMGFYVIAAGTDLAKHWAEA